MLHDVFIFFKIHDFKKFLFLKIIDFIMIRQHRENYFKKLSNLDCFRFLHFTQKFDSSTFFIQLIKLTLQNNVIRFEYFDNQRVERIECLFIVINFFIDIVSLCDAKLDVVLRWKFVDVFCFVRIMIINLLLCNVINMKWLFILLES